MNHRLNARVHRYPVCPECNAFDSCPCTTASGMAREPHRVRTRLADGELFILTAGQARAAGLITRLRRFLSRAA